jgi:hypothetical protein
MKHSRILFTQEDENQEATRHLSFVAHYFFYV